MSILELEDISVAVGDPKATSAGAEKTLIEGVSLSVESGKIHVLLGPNGSGKSSLLNAVMGHPKYVIKHGSISIDGEDITTLATEKKAKKGIFLSLQHVPEIGGVSMTNFLHRAYRDLKASDIGAVDFYKQTEKRAIEAGIDPIFLKRNVGSGLSGGEKKLGEVLQLLALEPKFALLDEIDSGVDVDAMKKVYAAITKLAAQEIGFLLVTHHPSVLEYITPDAVTVMRAGKVVASGDQELAKTILKNGFENI